MKLKCRINGKDYDIVQGATFVDNFNETLDSATICLNQVYKIDNLQPYDDVYIWNADETFIGYINKGDSEIPNCIIETTIETDDNSSSEDIVLGDDGINITSFGSIFSLSGPIIDIWLYRYLFFNNSNENDCIYNIPKMSLRILLATIINDSDLGGEAHFEYGFYLTGNGNHGTITDKLLLTNGTYSFECYISSNNTITVDSSRKHDPINKPYTIGGIDVTSSSYSLSSTYMNFNLNIQSQNIISQNVQTFSLKIQYRTKNYIFNCVGISNDFTTSGNAYRCEFSNSSLGKIAIRLHKTNDGYYAMLNKNSSDVLAGRNIFSEITHLSVSTLTLSSNSKGKLPSFYKHLLVNTIKEEMLGLETGLYSYTLELFSETKKLEKIILPNISITQSLVQEEKRSCWFYLNKYIDMYSPKYKKVTNLDAKYWSYVKKYKISESGEDKDGIIENLKELFDNTICPEMSFTNPSLKDVISQIMIVKDIIPIVKDDVIYGLDIGNINGNFDRTGNSQYNATNFTVANMNSSDFSTDARREYSNALSQENSAHMVEYLGFRNPDSAFLTLDGLTLQTRFPIYKINSIKMCYYKVAHLIDSTTNSEVATKLVLIKQDITSLVLQNTVRNSLSTNWETFRSGDNPNEDPHDYSDINYSNIQSENAGILYAAQYKLCTIGYDIGSNSISGWGETYEYLDFLWFKGENSYIENIVNLMDALSPTGDKTNAEFVDDDEGNLVVNIYRGIQNIIAFDGTTDNIAKQIKSIVFEVDYNAMFNGTVMHSKNNTDKDDLETADNCSSALTVLEVDGLYEKEKMERIGNKVFTIIARYDQDNGGANPNRVQNIGTYDELTDSIIYTREYQIYDNVVLTNYQSTPEYALKNYFTTVWAKYRTYSLMPYSESIKRAENVRKFLFLSKNTAYNEKISEDEELSFTDSQSAECFLSFTKATPISNNRRFVHNEKLNCGYFVIYDGDTEKRFLSDINAFASGYSLCFNICTFDNVSGGTYIDEMGADLSWSSLMSDEEQQNDYKTTQKWWSMVNSTSDAFVEKIGFYVCHLDEEHYYHSYITSSSINAMSSYFQRYMKLPGLIPGSNYLTLMDNYSSYKIGANSKTICKDNKEILDITMQFSYIYKDDEDVLFSPWICKLNDFVASYNKTEKTEYVVENILSTRNMRIFITDFLDDNNRRKIGEIILRLPEDAFKNINVGQSIYNSEIFPLYLNFTCIRISWNDASKYEGDGMASLRLESITNVSEENSKKHITIRSTISLTATERQWAGLLWGAVWVGGAGTDYNATRTFDIEFVQEYIEQGEDGTNYYYFVGYYNIDNFRFVGNNEYVQNWGDPPTEGSFFLYTNKIPLIDEGNFENFLNNLNTDTSLIKDTYIDLSNEHNSLQASYPQNMFVVVSSQKLDKRLEYNSYRYNSSKQINTFPNTMFVDENTHISSIFRTFNSLSDSNGLMGLEVDPSIYENSSSISFKVKSVQYYFRDNNTDIMYFVFGVNLYEISNNQISYRPFRIYLSTMSKRSPYVYDSYHNIVGRISNVLDNQYVSSTEQCYEEIAFVSNDYQKVQFLESDGNQIINTNINFDKNYYIDIDCMLSDKINIGYIFGFRQNLYREYSIELDNLENDQGGIKVKLSNSNIEISESNRIKLDTNRRYKIRCSNQNITIDRINVYESSNTLYSGNYAKNPSLLGCKNMNNNFVGRIYGFKIYEYSQSINDSINLKHNFMPCIRKSDKEPGLYDTVEKKFYPNNGTGKFKFRY